MMTRGVERRLYGVVLVLGVAAVVGSAGGCTGPTAKPLTPVVSAAEGRQIVESYASRNNRANRTRNAALLGQIETNPLLEVSLADYQAERVLKLPAGEDFTYAEPRTYAPSLPSYPHWFVSFARQNGDSRSGDLSVFVQDVAAGPWHKTLDVGIGSQSIRPITKGLAAQPPAAGSTPAMTAALRATTSYLEQGAASPALDVAHTSAVDFRTLVTHLAQGAGKGGSARVGCTAAGPGGTFNLATATGQLVLTSQRCTLRSDAGPGQQITLSGPWRGLTPDVTARRHTIVTVHQLALAITSKGRTTVLGDDWQPVSVTGR